MAKCNKQRHPNGKRYAGIMEPTSWCLSAVCYATGITGVEYGDSQEIVNKWGAGRYPVGRAKGRITPSCKLILYPEEVQALSAQSPTGRLQDLPPVDIIVRYIPGQRAAGNRQNPQYQFFRKTPAARTS